MIFVDDCLYPSGASGRIGSDLAEQHNGIIAEIDSAGKRIRFV
eukprot:SAG11_NODE_12385_length_706_cov_0.835255_2_plen_42_part_01